jgi:hypothetical protein
MLVLFPCQHKKEERAHKCKGFLPTAGPIGAFQQRIPAEAIKMVQLRRLSSVSPTFSLEGDISPLAVEEFQKRQVGQVVAAKAALLSTQTSGSLCRHTNLTAPFHSLSQAVKPLIAVGDCTWPQEQMRHERLLDAKVDSAMPEALSWQEWRNE